MHDHHHLANLIWQISGLLRGPYRPAQYGRVMLPMTVLRRFECVLAETKGQVLAEYRRLRDRGIEGQALDERLNQIANGRFHNHSSLDLKEIRSNPDTIGPRLAEYIAGFSENVRRIFECFEIEKEAERMHDANILYLVVSNFADVDLHPACLSSAQMGLIYEDLIRRSNELAGGKAGDHSAPPDVARLMVSILFTEDREERAAPGAVRRLLDPACGTGGILAEARRYLRKHHPAAKLLVCGQDDNRRAFATAKSSMLTGAVNHDGIDGHVRYGDSLFDDQFPGETFDYVIASPPIGRNWRKQRREVEEEHEARGFDGRFGAGMPRVSDGSLLFLQHMWAKRRRESGRGPGSRLAVALSGPPLFAGNAGSGESDIRKWIIENDWLETVIALPGQMLYGTGVGVYVCVLTDRKSRRRAGKIRLIDARNQWTAGAAPGRRRSLGGKRRHLSDDQVADIVRRYGGSERSMRSKLIDNDDLGYTRVTVERPLRLRYQMTVQGKLRFLNACPDLLDDVQEVDKALGRAPIRDWNFVETQISTILRDRGSKWRVSEWKVFRSVFAHRDPNAAPVRPFGRAAECEADPRLRDFENIPLTMDIESYCDQEIRPFAPDAWVDRTKDRVGYALNFGRHFRKRGRRRTLSQIDGELKNTQKAMVQLLRQVTA